MDGLPGDADIVFLLATNRPDLLEPALAARPGRIDQAIEIPLPDSTCRRAALLAAEERAEPIVVMDRQLDDALQELVIEGGELTKTLLGGAPTPP